MAEDTNTGDRRMERIGREAANKEFGRGNFPPPRRGYFAIAVTLGMIIGFAIGEIVSHALPPPLDEALKIVTDILDTEYKKAVNQQRSNRTRRPNDQLCEENARKLVQKIVKQTIKKVEQKIRELERREPAECESEEPCQEVAIAFSSSVSREAVWCER